MATRNKTQNSKQLNLKPLTSGVVFTNTKHFPKRLEIWNMLQKELVFALISIGITFSNLSKRKYSLNVLVKTSIVSDTNSIDNSFLSLIISFKVLVFI